MGYSIHMTTTENTTTADIYAALAGNMPARRAVNEILHDAAVRPRRVNGRSYTTAQEIARVDRLNAKHDAAILAFIGAVRKAKTDARVEAAIVTLKKRTGLLDCATAPAALAAALRNA